MLQHGGVLPSDAGLLGPAAEAASQVPGGAGGGDQAADQRQGGEDPRPGGLEQQRAQEGQRRVPGHHLRQGRGGLRPLHTHRHLRVRGLQNCPENHWLTRHLFIDSIQYSCINDFDEIEKIFK